MSEHNLKWTDADMIQFGRECIFSIANKVPTTTQDTLDKFKASKTPVKEKLFTTTDGVDIYFGEWCWVVSPETSFGWTPCKVLMNATPLDVRGKYFSTEQAASEFVLLNKPCLSVQDLLYCHVDFRMSYYRIIKELAKQKLSQ